MEIGDFATVNTFDPTLRRSSMENGPVAEIRNLVGGKWIEPGYSTSRRILDPLTGAPMLDIPDQEVDSLDIFADSLKKCPSYGRHNPKWNVERYLMLGRVCEQAAQALATPKIEDFFTHLIQRVMPKSEAQCRGEVRVTRAFLSNFAGDRVRFLATGTTSPGDHLGQRVTDQLYPFGPVVVIVPFNFPIEIPVLQVMGALFMGNHPLVHVDQRVAVVFHQFVRLLHECGLPPEDIDLMTCSGDTMGEFHNKHSEIIRMVQFTGSTPVANAVTLTSTGRIKKEDAGFDWKILGPDYKEKCLEYVAHQCDQDAYAASGQKCSAQSLLAVHKNWPLEKLFNSLKDMAARRKLSDLTIGPVMSWTTDEMLRHIKMLCSLKGAKLLFGGKELKGHTIPKCYGAIEPTAVFIPLETILESAHTRAMVTREVFGPFQVITQFSDDDMPTLLSLLESMESRLTAAIVSNDPIFVNKILGATTNGTTYVGYRARTTGAPQNHWFGPCGDPRDAGIGTDYAIRETWSSNRCIVEDPGPIPADWSSTVS